MAYQVKVILSALEGSMSPAVRTFVLDPTRTMIPVGRASKSVSKGLRGAVDNAWFDSPVMSRDHAEISFKSDTKTLLIQDIGSMHGTMLNGVQIPGNECKEVGEGDKLTFGAEVRRGQESFSACAFRVNYEFQPYKSSNTFAFPDSSDVEDEDDYPFSEEEFIMEHLSGEESLSLGSPLSKASQVVNAIDLTRDDSPVRPAFDGIDLTRDTPVAAAIEGPAAPEPQDIVNIEEADEHTPSLDAEHIQLDSDDSEDGDFTSDSDNDSEVQSTKEGPASDDEFDLEEIEDSVNDDLDSIGEVFQVSDNAPKDAITTENYPDFTDFTCSKPGANSAERLVYEAVDNEDVELAKAGAEGIRAMINASLLHNDSSPTYHYNHFQTLLANESSTSPDGGDRSFVLPTTGYSDTTSSALPLQLPSLTQGLRAPSPSDAAMAKPTDLNCFQTLHSQQNNAQDLGEKSGKQEFFKAREYNKAILQGHTILQGKGAEVRAAPFSTFAPDHQKAVEPQAAFPPSSRPIKACVGKLPKIGILKTVAGEGSSTDFPLSFKPHSPSDYAPPHLNSLLDFPDQENSTYRAPSPSFDMTSAVKYNESKASMKKPENTASNVGNYRSGLRIDDIIDTSMLEEGNVRRKRKSNELSESVEEEVRVWASIDKPDDMKSATPSASNANSHTQPSNGQIRISEGEQQRPTKRLKKIMENVAYIALGGVTVGAALFGGLVATAPDFI